MSEYTPITGELRDAMETDEQCGDLFGINYLRISEGRLCRLCDAIDSIHAQLERENAALKAELGRVLGEDERDWWIELPRDADGVPIRVGDVMESDYIIRTEVAAVGVECFFAWSNIDRRWHQYEANQFRHHVPDTWERIIEEVLQRGHDDYPLNVDIEPYVARCKALCERTMSGDAE